MIFEKVLLDGVVTPKPMQHSLSETKKNAKTFSQNDKGKHIARGPIGSACLI